MMENINGNSPSQWLQGVVEQMLTQLATQQNQTMATLAERISRLEERPTTTAAPSVHTPDALTPQPTT